MRLRRTYTIGWLRTELEGMGMYTYQLRTEIDQQYGHGTWDAFVRALERDEDIPATHIQDAIIGRIAHYSTRAQRMELEQPEPSATPSAPGPSFYSDSSSFTFSTQNIEKYGQATDKAPKWEQIVEAVDTTLPDVATFQEVTDPALFVGDVLPNLPYYEGLEGAAYQSHNYKESYPALFNTATIHDPPQLFFIDPATDKEKEYRQKLYFGKEAAKKRRLKNLKQARPTSFWQFRLPASRYNLRPAVKGFKQDSRERYEEAHANLRHRRFAAYRTVRWLNVHTSPGKSTPTINQQVNKILEEQLRILKKYPNTGSSGDFYAQRGSRRNFARFSKGDKGLKLIHPGVNTNFKKGEGKQTADHFILPENWSGSKAFAIAPFEKKGTESLEEKFTFGKGEANLSKWEASGIDHAYVFGFSQVNASETEKLIWQIVQRYLQQQQYRTNNCLIHAIADAAGVHLSDNDLRLIRDDLAQRGTAVGDFIEASAPNIKIIMRRLRVSGNVQIVNLDNIHHAAAPVFIPNYQGSRAVAITINYSRYHFFATPGR